MTDLAKRFHALPRGEPDSNQEHPTFATFEDFRRDGWVRHGRLSHLDDGVAPFRVYLYVKGRNWRAAAASGSKILFVSEPVKELADTSNAAWQAQETTIAQCAAHFRIKYQPQPFPYPKQEPKPMTVIKADPVTADDILEWALNHLAQPKQREPMKTNLLYDLIEMWTDSELRNQAALSLEEYYRNRNYEHDKYAAVQYGNWLKCEAEMKRRHLDPAPIHNEVRTARNLKPLETSK